MPKRKKTSLITSIFSTVFPFNIICFLYERKHWLPWCTTVYKEITELATSTESKDLSLENKLIDPNSLVFHQNNHKMGAIKKGEEISLYDPSILLKLDFHRSPAKFNPFISAAAPGEPWLKVRPLQDGDYNRGFLEILSQLTDVGNVSLPQFLNRFAQMRASGDYYVTVIEDTRKNKIIGSATLILERKFIRNCAIRGQLEDVVVDDTYRGKQLGKLIVVTVSLLSEYLGCYKMTLNCKDKLIPFYRSIGYVDEKGNANAMNIRFPGDGVVKSVTKASGENVEGPS